MRLDELARRIGARVLTDEKQTGDIEVRRIFAGDRISDILDRAAGADLLVTHLVNNLIPRVAGLIDLPGICILNGSAPGADVLQAAADHRMVLLVSPDGMYETCGRLYAALCENGQGD